MWSPARSPGIPICHWRIKCYGPTGSEKLAWYPTEIFSFLFFPFLCEPLQSNSWMLRALIQIYFSRLWWKVCVLEPLRVAEFIFNNISILAFQSPYAFLISSSTLTQSRTDVSKLLTVGHHLVHVLAIPTHKLLETFLFPPVSVSKSESLLSANQ